VSATEELRRAHARAMEIAGVLNPERVSIHFDVFRPSNPEPLFTILARVPHRDRRRSDEHARGMGETLDEALVDFERRIAVAREDA